MAPNIISCTYKGGYMSILETTVLESINSPEDVKKLSLEKMNILSDEIRQGILNRVNKIGGHLGPGLGIVEATIALHYVFDSPKDKIIFLILRLINLYLMFHINATRIKC